MIDAVAATARGATLQSAQLIYQFGIVEQIDASAVEQRQQILSINGDLCD